MTWSMSGETGRETGGGEGQEEEERWLLWLWQDMEAMCEHRADSVSAAFMRFHLAQPSCQNLARGGGLPGTPCWQVDLPTPLAGMMLCCYP
jgi:hypothetical protein